MKRLLRLAPQPPKEDQLILSFDSYRVARATVEFDLNVDDIPEIIKILLKQYDDFKKEENVNKVKV